MRINHVTILVKNKTESKIFYTEILGLKKFERNGRLWIKVGDQFIHITDNSGKPVRGTFYHFAIEVKGLKNFVNKIRVKGVKIFDVDIKPLPANEVLKSQSNYFIKDPDGNLIEFIEENNHFFNGK